MDSSDFCELNRVLVELGHLNQGWNSYGAAVPNEKAISTAMFALECLELQKHLLPKIGISIEVRASCEDGIVISIRREDCVCRYYSEMECFNTGEVIVVLCYGLRSGIKEIARQQIPINVVEMVEHLVEPKKLETTEKENKQNGPNQIKQNGS